MPSDDAPPTLLARFLDETDARCPRCKYQLRGTPGTACPECGRALELRICAPPPRLDAFFVGVIALAFSTGYTGIWTGLMLWHSLSRGKIALMWNPGIMRMEVGLAINGTALLVWILMRRWFAVQRPMVRRVLTLATVALLVATFVALRLVR